MPLGSCLLGILVVVGACVPLDSGDSPATLTVENGTSQVIITLTGRPDTSLAAALAQGLPVPPIEPGEVQIRALGSQNEAGEWCNPGDYWVLRPLIAIDGQTRSSELTPEDVVVIEQRSGEACFGTNSDAYVLIE